MSEATLYKWRAKSGGLDASRMKIIEEENRRLKKMYAEEQPHDSLNDLTPRE